MPPETLSDSIQHYLRTIYNLSIGAERVSTTALARSQKVSPASASAMVKKLAALGLAEHTPYRGVALTHDGELVALEVIRHHRLLELYLARTLGISVDEVHAEADKLEHALSEELEARIDEALGFPTHDPHGDPIPDANLEWPGAKPTSGQPPALEPSSGPRPSGPKPSAPKPAGPTLTGSKPSGPKPSGPRPSGPRPSGPKPSPHAKPSPRAG